LLRGGFLGLLLRRRFLGALGPRLHLSLLAAGGGSPTGGLGAGFGLLSFGPPSLSSLLHDGLSVRRLLNDLFPRLLNLHDGWLAVRVHHRFIVNIFILLLLFFPFVDLQIFRLFGFALYVLLLLRLFVLFVLDHLSRPSSLGRRFGLCWRWWSWFGRCADSGRGLARSPLRYPLRRGLGLLDLRCFLGLQASTPPNHAGRVLLIVMSFFLILCFFFFFLYFFVSLHLFLFLLSPCASSSPWLPLRRICDRPGSAS
jgi:hypothetical protein